VSFGPATTDSEQIRTARGRHDLGPPAGRSLSPVMGTTPSWLAVAKC